MQSRGVHAGAAQHHDGEVRRPAGEDAPHARHVVGADGSDLDGPGAERRQDAERLLGVRGPDPDDDRPRQVETAPGPGVRRSGWLWAALTGAGMVAGGVGAAVIALGPVLLPYDEAFLDADVHALHRLDPNLVGFLQHDRITLAGTMAAIGVLYLGFAAAMRRGAAWARGGLLASGLVGFPTLAYLLVWGFVEPLHTALTAVLLPMWIAAVRRPPGPAPRSRPPAAAGPERVRRRRWSGSC